MTPLDGLYKQEEEKMKKALAIVTRELGEVRGGRATPALVEHLTVDYYGAPTPLKQLAAITSPEPSMLVVQPWDGKAVQDIERAILKASIGVTPMIDGKLVRIPIPPLTGDRRTELTKVIHKMAEEGRINIRNVRRDANETVKKLKGEKKITEDESFKGQDTIQKLTDKYIGQIDALVKAKEQELHTV